MELGLGIHGEPGVKRMPMQPADELTETLLTAILQHGKFGSRSEWRSWSTIWEPPPTMELAIVARHAVGFLESKGFTVEQNIRRNISFLTRYGGNLDFRSRPERRAAALARRGHHCSCVAQRAETASGQAGSADRNRRSSTSAMLGRPAARKRRRAEKQTGSHRGRLQGLDRRRRRADGDGPRYRRWRPWQRAWRVRPGQCKTRSARILWTIFPLRSKRSVTPSARVGWIIGATYGVLFLRCGSVLEGARRNRAGAVGRSVGSGLPGHQRIGWREAGRPHHAGCARSLREDTAAGQGVKTTREAILAAVEAAERGVEATAQMKPRLGRSSYLGDRVLGHPDPGAKAVALWLRAACEALFPH